MSGRPLPCGLALGHWSDPVRRTGCTVVLAPSGAIGAADVRGGAPGTRETQLFAPGNLVSEVHAVLLTGGSAFGLAAASGVMRFLRERGVGVRVGPGVVPIVPAAVLFDLGVGDPEAFPDEEAGYAAARAASPRWPEEGAVGAGSGATVGKLLGAERSSRGGVGIAAVSTPAGIVLAIAAVNAFGDVLDETGAVIAGARGEDGEFAGIGRSLREADLSGSPMAGANTTLVCAATDAPLDPPSLKRMAIECHDGIARAVRPAHSLVDGDVVFSLAVRGEPPGTLARLRLGEAAAEATAAAIRRAVL